MQTARSAGVPGDRSKRWWFEKAINERKPFVGKSYYSLNGNIPVTPIIFPIYDENAMFTGVFGADIKLDADVEIGGTDQLFNLMAGRVLQKAFGRKPQAVMTMELIYGLDGRKMSTSWGNTIAIVDPPHEQFGKLMSIGDELIIAYLIACTDVPIHEIDKVADGLRNGSVHPMDAKKQLAREIVKLYHGLDAANEAEDHFQRTVQQKELPQNIPSYVIDVECSIVDLLVNSGIVPSRSEARRLVEQGGVSFGDIKVHDPKAVIGEDMFLLSESGRIILKAGKRRYIELVWKGGFMGPNV
jgi:tyrosyl-tRNA synthetase